MSRTIHAISDDLLALEDLLIETGGDITDEEQERIVDGWLGQLGAERDAKLDSYAALIKELEARAKARKEAEQQLAARRKADESLSRRLKDRLVYFFRRNDWKTIETLRFRLTRASAGGKDPLVVDGDPDNLPERFQTVTVTLRFCPADLTDEADERLFWLLSHPIMQASSVATADTEKIRAALDAGEELPFARYGERSEYLRIS